MHQFIGHGVLRWNRDERISDRYGSVQLFDQLNGELLPMAPWALGYRGSLLAVVHEVRDSRHIGDLFRGFRPSRPRVGEMIVLGSGTVFYEDTWSIGVRPDDGRETDWLDPSALYRVHEQTVDLFLVTEGT